MKLFVVGRILLHIFLNTDACTEIRKIAEDSSVIVARSFEYGFDFKSRVIREPEGYFHVAGNIPLCKFSGIAPLNWTNLYSVLLVDSMGSGQAIDGMNAAGLSVGALLMPGGFAKYENCPMHKCGFAVSHMELPGWLLSNFATVQQVRDAMDGDGTWPVIGKWFPTLGLHWSVTDKTGDSIIIEYTDDGRQVYNNTIGVLTNSPGYDWHMLNFRNYLGLSNYNHDPLVLGPDEFPEFGQGSGLLGLPGDLTPPSRFIRAGILINFSGAVNNSVEAINLVYHVMNSVDIPKGIQKEQGSGTADYTQWIVIKDLKNKVLYYRGYEDVTLYQVRMLDDASFTDGTQPIPIDKPWGGAVDITDQLEKGVGHTELR